MISSILSSIAKLAANELLKSLFSSGLFKSGGPLGFLSSLKFADGGFVSGPGTVQRAIAYRRYFPIKNTLLKLRQLRSSAYRF
jgi:hypothetical protein